MGTMSAMIARGICLFVLVVTVISASEPFVKKEMPPLKSGKIEGGVLTPDRSAIVTWGTELWRWPLTSANPQRLSASKNASFGEGGCFADINQDSQPDLVLEEKPIGATLGKLVWLEAPQWQRHEIDTGIEMSECQGVNLFGHRGILMVQRHLQVRLYEPTSASAAENDWSYQEIYSFYTPSRQAGLLLADIDQDGYPDILCGNYWIKSPTRFDLPWRLFAIDLYNEEPKSATLRLAILNHGRDLFVSQREMPDARVAWLKRPPDPRQLWEEHRLGIEGGLRFASGLLAGDLDGTGGVNVLIGENNGAQSRLVLLKEDNGRFKVIWKTKVRPVLQLLPVDNGLITIGPAHVTLFRKILTGVKAPSASMR